MINNNEKKQGLIRIITGEYRSGEIRLEDGETIKVGRAVDNDLILEDQKSVSRNHCAITWYAEEEAFGVCDTSSSGTRREDTHEFIPKQDEELRLEPGTVISIGGVENQLLLTAVGSDGEVGAGLYPGLELEGRYIVDRLMTRRSGSAIYRCMDKTLGTPVAIKAFSDNEKAKREAKNLARLRNARDIVNVYGVLDNTDRTFIVMEYIEWKRLDDLMKEQVEFDPSIAQKLIDNILMAVKKFHAEEIFQGVLSPENIFVSPDGSFDVKVYIGMEEAEDGLSIADGIDGIREKLYELLLSDKQLKKRKRNRRIKTVVAVFASCMVVGAAIVVILMFAGENKLITERLEGEDFSSDKIEIWVDKQQTVNYLKEIIKDGFGKTGNVSSSGTDEQDINQEIIEDNHSIGENAFEVILVGEGRIIEYKLQKTEKKPDMILTDSVENISDYNLVSLKDTVYAALNNTDDYYFFSEDEVFENGYEIMPTGLEVLNDTIVYNTMFSIFDNGNEKKVLACERLLLSLLSEGAQKKRDDVGAPINKKAMEYYRDNTKKFRAEIEWLDENANEEEDEDDDDI